MRFQTLHGLGDCQPSGLDDFGELCLYVPPATLNNPVVDALATNYINTPTGTLPGSGSVPSASTVASGGINWGNLIGTLANDATKIGQQAIATPGTVIGPNGQVISGGGVISSASSSTAMNLTALMPMLLLGGGALILLVVLKGRR